MRPYNMPFRLLLPSSTLVIVLLILLWHVPTLAAQELKPDEVLDFEVEPFVSNITFPVAMAFASDGRLFVAERFVGTTEPVTGAIRVIAPDGTVQATPFLTLTLASTTPFAEKGLLGLALDPTFEENGYLYTYRTATPDAANPAQHGEIVRFSATLSGTNWIGTERTTVVDNLPVASGCCHNGGVLHFGPDGKLYLSIGDNGTPANAQSLGSRAGKLLRFNADGTIPRDNPFTFTAGADPAIYAYGLRNLFGYAWHPTTGALYGNENGPTCNDELNRIVPGGNYGWPLSFVQNRCINPSSAYRAPLWTFDPPVGLTGATFYTGTLVPTLQNHLLLGAWNNGALYDVTLEEDGTVAAVTTLLENCGQPSGDHNLLDVATGPDGALYFSCQEESFPAPPQTGTIYRLAPPVPTFYYLPLVGR
jgi:aldose sugar dehydrogenase